MSINDEAVVLASIPAFQPLGEKKIKLLAFASDLVEYPAGKIILKQGEFGNSVFVTVKGCVEVDISRSETESEKLEMGKHSILGELSVIKGTLRAATVTAKTDIVALRISKSVFQDMMNDQPKFKAALTAHMNDAGYSNSN